MNIFYLDPNPVCCAMYHGNKHVVKMILEYAQLLCTAHHLCDNVLDDDERAVLYRLTHQNHPSALWVRASATHYHFLYELFVALCEEYRHRYGRTHLTDHKLRQILAKCPVSTITPFVPPPQVMPSQYQGDDCVQAYREYYRQGKAEMLVYTGRAVPDWVSSR